MNNPYEAPISDVAKEKGGKPHPAHRPISMFIAVMCGLQFATVCWSIVAYLAAGGTGPDGAPVRALPLIVALMMPLSLFLGGIFLVLRRTLAGVFFAAYLVQYLMQVFANGGLKLVPFVLGSAFLAYAVWRWKAGHLKGWPAVSSPAEDQPVGVD